MRRSARFLIASQAAARLGVSAKALRIYEQHRLIAPGRTAAGWRVYGPADMARAAEVVRLRALGLDLAEVARLLAADGGDLAARLAGYEARLQRQARALAGTLDAVRRLRTPGSAAPTVSFDLPWPWGGERFELRGMAPTTYLTGPLGSGKTRLAQRIAEVAPGGAFIGLDRLAEGAAAARLADDRALQQRVDTALAALVTRGAQRSPALTALLVALVGRDGDVLVVDMVEAGLDPPTQVALMAWLRGAAARQAGAASHDAFVVDPRPRRHRRWRGDSALPGQPQPAALGVALARRARLRGGGDHRRDARGARADRRHCCSASSRGVSRRRLRSEAHREFGGRAQRCVVRRAVSGDGAGRQCRRGAGDQQQ